MIAGTLRGSIARALSHLKKTISSSGRPLILFVGLLEDERRPAGNLNISALFNLPWTLDPPSRSRVGSGLGRASAQLACPLIGVCHDNLQHLRGRFVPGSIQFGNQRLERISLFYIRLE